MLLKILVTKANQFPTVFLQYIMVTYKNMTLKKGIMFVVAVTGDKQSRPGIANMQ